MTRWLPALVAAALVTLAAPPRLRRWAFTHGWFERSTETDRSRRERRPTHGGAVAAAALVAAALFAGPDARATLAVAVAAAIAVASSWRAERGRGPSWAVPVGRAVASAAVPLCGIRAELTGNDAVDVVLTALATFTLIAGIARLDRTDGTAPAVAAIAAAGLLAVAVRAEQEVAAVAAGVVGAGFGILAHTGAPADLRIGRTGPTVLGTALAVAAVELEPTVGAPRSALVPVLALAVAAAAAFVPGWGLRLEARRIPPTIALAVAAAAGAFAADAVAHDALDPVPAAAAAGAPLLLLLTVAALTRRPAELGPARRWPVVAGVGLAVAGGAAALPAGLAVLDAREDMQTGRRFAEEGLEAARDGNLETARAAFARADTAFSSADDQLGSPLLRLGDVVPGIAQNLRSARTLADVGRALSTTAVDVADRAGAEDLLVVDGVFPVDASRAVAVELATAVDELAVARGRLTGVTSPYLVAEAEEAIGSVGERIDDASESIEVAALASRLVPDLLGGDGPRRFFVGLLSGSELRGAGGIMGDFAELVATDGDIELVRVDPIATLNASVDFATFQGALPEIYREEYAGFFPLTLWQNLTASPDGPTVAQAIAAQWPLTGGGPLDGVVTVDAIGLSHLLEITGPVSVPPWPDPISADNAADVLLFDSYNQLTDPQLDRFQSDVVRAVVDALTTTTLPPPSELAATLAPAVAGGNLRLWSPDSDEQALFERIGADGMLPPADGTDSVMLVTQNAAESKIDYYLRRELRYDVTYDPATGQTSAIADVTLTNEAPASGVADVILGELGGPTLRGHNESTVTLYTPLDVVDVLDVADTPTPVSIGREGGLTSIQRFVSIPPGQSVTTRFLLEGVLATSPRYRLLVGRQPTPFPDVVEVSVHAPNGWAVDAQPVANLTVREPTRVSAHFSPN